MMTVPTPLFPPLSWPHMPPIRRHTIGHRGLAALAPENTLAGFRAAKAQGLSWVEFDIQLCSSGEWVVFHDERLERTTDGRGLLATHTCTALKRLDAGAWFTPPFPNERIPLLTETLALLSTLPLHPNIEVKLPDTVQTAEKQSMAIGLHALIRNHWLPPWPLLSSFDLAFLQAFRRCDVTWPMGYLVERLQPSHFATAQAEGFDTVNADFESILDYITNTEHSSQAPPPTHPVLAYTVNDTALAHRLLEAGVSAIFSDKADIFE